MVMTVYGGVITTVAVVVIRVVMITVRRWW
jgi:hypothetical protein